jgi:hypothetical protein
MPGRRCCLRGENRYGLPIRHQTSIAVRTGRYPAVAPLNCLALLQDKCLLTGIRTAGDRGEIPFCKYVQGF